jgi:hypothetical protein
MRFRAKLAKAAFTSAALIACVACQPSTPLNLDCQFLPVQWPEDQLPNCASVDKDGTIALEPMTISAVRSRDHDPVAVRIGSTLYYVNSDGRIAPVLKYDNGADYFVEGLARTPRQGKIGFIDRALVERIPPSWDFAFPFDGGVALVCQNCRPHAVGEHTEMRGGVWGYINREGDEVVRVRFDRAKLPAPPSQ